MNKTKTKWTHKVVKQGRDMQGQWSGFGPAFKGSFAECEAYAEQFLADQIAPVDDLGSSLKGHMGLRITIQLRGGHDIQKIYRY